MGGIGKSRIGFEIISETIGIDKGWIISEDGETKKVRVLKENFEDGILLYLFDILRCYIRI